MNLSSYERAFRMTFARIYPLYIQKAEKKGRTQAELDAVLCWLTGYDAEGLNAQIARETDLQTFFGEAPQINPHARDIKGVICGIRVEEIENPLMQQIRWMDKVVDELAKGKPLDKILRK